MTEKDSQSALHIKGRASHLRTFFHVLTMCYIKLFSALSMMYVLLLMAVYCVSFFDKNVGYFPWWSIFILGVGAAASVIMWKISSSQLKQADRTNAGKRIRKWSVITVVVIPIVIASGVMLRPKEYIDVSADNVKGLIIKASADSTDMPLLHQCSRAGPKIDTIQGFWTPEFSDIEKLELILPTYLKKQTATMRYYLEKGPLIDGSGYTRYYIGILYPDKRIIYVDFRRADISEKNLYSGIHSVVCDGGSFFFGIEFDVNSRSFSNLRFNGRG